MSSFKVHEPGYPCFITCSIVEWLPVFTDSRYSDVIIDSLDYCRKNKGLLIHGYVVMPTHLHAVMSSNGNLTDIVRDFKSHTARELKQALDQNGNTLFTWAFRRAAEMTGSRSEISFWQDGFHPEMIYDEEFLRQKLDYVHANPVRKGLVSVAEHWRYSSAAAYAGEIDVPLAVDFLDP